MRHAGAALVNAVAAVPRRVTADETMFASRADLADAMRRASIAHGEHEKRAGGEYDVNWPDLYAAYMIAEEVVP